MIKGLKLPSFLMAEFALYNNIMSDPSRKQLSTRLAKLSIIYSIIALLGTPTLFLLNLVCCQMPMVGLVSLILFVGVFGIIVPLVMMIKSAIAIYCQFKIRKGNMLYLALSLFIIVIIAMIVCIYFVQKLL